MGILPVVRITKQFRFEAAHALLNYDGLCSHIHGHSYMLSVTIKGNPITDFADPKNGMVMDFSHLKQIIHEAIIGPFDHSLMLNARTPLKELDGADQLFGRVVALPYQPTCENMIVDFAARIQKQLPPNVSLHSLCLHETSSSFAEWHASDNGN